MKPTSNTIALYSQSFSQELIERFWSRINKTESCWLWVGAKAKGYGVIRLPKSSTTLKAHRVSYAIRFGEVPNGIWVLHRCDNPPCCNPDHLFLGDVRDNVRDMIEKGRGATSEMLSFRQRGEKHSRLKLSEAEVLEIRRRYLEGETQTGLAAAFNVSQACIWMIIRKKRWSFLV